MNTANTANPGGRQQCQLALLDNLRVGRAEPAALPLFNRVMMTLSLHLSPGVKRFLRPYYLRLFHGGRPKTGAPIGGSAGSGALAPPAPPAPPAPAFAAGDPVRVRSQAEIEATLDQWGRLKGCRFMPEMLPYCGTQQTVLKPLERFFDEREYALKKARGLVLLKDVMCQGVALSGRCDRCCFFFWRIEWLEKLDG